MMQRAIVLLVIFLTLTHSFSVVKLAVTSKSRNLFASTITENLPSIPWDVSAPPPFTLNDVKSSIPKHLFVKDPIKSFSYLFKDLVLIASSISLIMKFGNFLTWPLYWITQAI